jgi:hypothetical protein
MSVTGHVFRVVMSPTWPVLRPYAYCIIMATTDLTPCEQCMQCTANATPSVIYFPVRLPSKFIGKF